MDNLRKNADGQCMATNRKQHSAEFKFNVALNAAKEQQTMAQLASEQGVHPNQISRWKQHLLQEGNTLFSDKRRREEPAAPAQREAELYEQIGRLKMELEWLKKKWSASVDARRQSIEPAHPTLSSRRQCELIGLNRSPWYYQPVPESAENRRVMRLIDEQYLRPPCYGWPRMAVYLRGLGEEVKHKRVQRLMQKMGLQAVYPKPRTTVSAPGHQVYPYLLRGLAITRPNQVWSADITSIRTYAKFINVLDIFTFSPLYPI